MQIFRQFALDNFHKYERTERRWTTEFKRHNIIIIYASYPITRLIKRRALPRRLAIVNSYYSRTTAFLCCFVFGHRRCCLRLHRFDVQGYFFDSDFLPDL